MRSLSKKGFVIIIVVAFLTVLFLAVAVVVNLGCGEILATKIDNDLSSAFYVAGAGAERMYAILKVASNGSLTMTWPQSDTLHNVQSQDGTIIGTYNASANTVSTNVFGIVSYGTVNGRTVRVTVKYGFDSPVTTGLPLGSVGPMTLHGTRWGPFRSWVRADGPLESASDITINETARVTGDVMPNQPLAAPNFWLYTKFDTKDLGYAYSDGGAGSITRAQALSQNADMIGTFDENDMDDNGILDDKDAFIYYYTEYLNNPANNSLGQDLGINNGGTNYYSASQSFNPWSVPAGTPVVFVNGDVDILFSDTAWWGAASDHAIIATGNINIVQPTNGSNDRLTLISYGDVNTGGVRAFGGVRGDLVVYANSGFNAYYGGRTNGAIIAKESVYVDTVLPIPGLLNRDLKKGSRDWSDPSTWPLGLPPGYITASPAFTIKDETRSAPLGYTPRWQRD